jgi:hypothetical protein
VSAAELVKPRYTRELLCCDIGNYHFRRGPKPRYPRRRFQFYRSGFPTLRIPGTLGSPVFSAAYYIALVCQVPISVARNDRRLAALISIVANLLMLTTGFRQLNASTRGRYRYLVEDFCSRLAGEPTLLKTHEKTAAFIYRRRSRGYIDRRVSTLRGLLIQALNMNAHPEIEAKPVGLAEWVRGNSKASREAERRNSANDVVRRALSDAMRKSRPRAWQALQPQERRLQLTRSRSSYHS